MSHYETMFILHNRELSEGESEVTMEESVRQMVAKVGGEVHHVIEWANRKLAYPIAGNQTATYLLTYLSGEGDFISRLNREATLSERVIRMMAFRIDEIPEGEELPGPLVEPGVRSVGSEEPVGSEESVGSEEEVEVEIDLSEKKRRAREAKAVLERLDYKNVYHLRRMVTGQGKLFSRIRSLLDAKRQHQLRQAVHRARVLALLPFVSR